MPFMSDGVVGAMTFKPGTCVKFENSALECCAPWPQPRPMTALRRAAQAAARCPFSCHGVRIRGPTAVMATVNSKCAASEPSWE